MSKLLMLSGLPASGKSTYAEEKLKEWGNGIRLNKDLLRKMLHFDKFTGRNEGLTNYAEMALARYYLAHNVNVIVDDTNLGETHRQRWLGLSKECNAKWETHRMGTSMQECIDRDIARPNPVGTDVIRRMALQYQLNPKPEKGFILCDIDGTVADCSHRLHFVKLPRYEFENKDDSCNLINCDIAVYHSHKADWKSFYANVHNDPPRTEIIQQIRKHFIFGYTIVFTSGRPEDYKKETIDWLERHVGLAEYYLLMRRAGDSREDSVVKQDILKTYFPDKSVIKKVYDDRPRVIRMWQEEGLEVEDVGEGIEF